jgi:hypothetical protein
LHLGAQKRAAICAQNTKIPKFFLLLLPQELRKNRSFPLTGFFDKTAQVRPSYGGRT